MSLLVGLHNHLSAYQKNYTGQQPNAAKKVFFNYIRKKLPDYENKLVFPHLLRFFEHSRILKIHAFSLLLNATGADNSINIEYSGSYIFF